MVLFCPIFLMNVYINLVSLQQIKVADGECEDNTCVVVRCVGVFVCMCVCECVSGHLN